MPAYLRTVCTIILTIIATSQVNSALAFEATSTEKWYQIEYIIFEHLQTDDHILRYEDIPYPTKTNKQFSHITSNPQPLSKFQFTQLPEEKMVLANAFQKLKRSRAVEILDMKAWQQALPETSVPPMKIEHAVSRQRTLFGELQLKKSRYTHAEFKLYLAHKISLPYQDIKDWFLKKNTNGKLIDIITPITDPDSFSESIGVSDLYQNIRYLGESRRIKEGEIHYIDHPVISAIITIKEVLSPFDMINDLSDVR
tara:strand:+ start:956 stop:1717 length:762 start_codon:yes stop_codon:yes gene_type:complete